MIFRIKYRTLALMLGLMIILASMIFADENVPIGAEGLTEVSNEFLNASQIAVRTHNAQAGNISNLTISGRTQTKHWQGYYGEITGTITLDDAQNWTLYDWPNNEPKGEIYATTNETTPLWNSVKCFNFTGGTDGSGTGNLTVWENYYNMTYNDVDGIDETFNMTTHLTFAVGGVQILADSCPNTFTHVNDAFQQDKFLEVILTDDNGQLIFASIIENDDEANNTDPMGFDSDSHDFQLLVAEDGTSLDGTAINKLTDTYYFYLDME